jgi:hypothetical protein
MFCDLNLDIVDLYIDVCWYGVIQRGHSPFVRIALPCIFLNVVAKCGTVRWNWHITPDLCLVTSWLHDLIYCMLCELCSVAPFSWIFNTLPMPWYSTVLSCSGNWRCFLTSLMIRTTCVSSAGHCQVTNWYLKKILCPIDIKKNSDEKPGFFLWAGQCLRDWFEKNCMTNRDFFLPPNVFEIDLGKFWWVLFFMAQRLQNWFE